jgi:PEP-CTERM motif
MNMKYVCLPFAVATAVLMLTALTPINAKADILYSPTSPGIMQTDNNPCIIGDASCDTNTKNVFPLPYTESTSPCTNGDCDFFSPLYVAGPALALPNTIPTSFDVGVDDNIAEGQGAERLTAFNVFSCDSTGNNCTLFDSMGANAPVDLNYTKGTGYTDGLLSDFKPLISGDYYEFEASWTNDTDGMEQFWIIPSDVPEPGEMTLLLMGFGLLGLAGTARRRLAKA